MKLTAQRLGDTAQKFDRNIFMSVLQTRNIGLPGPAPMRQRLLRYAGLLSRLGHGIAQFNSNILSPHNLALTLHDRRPYCDLCLCLIKMSDRSYSV